MSMVLLLCWQKVAVNMLAMAATSAMVHAWFIGGGRARENKDFNGCQVLYIGDGFNTRYRGYIKGVSY